MRTDLGQVARGVANHGEGMMTRGVITRERRWLENRLVLVFSPSHAMAAMVTPTFETRGTPPKSPASYDTRKRLPLQTEY